MKRRRQFLSAFSALVLVLAASWMSPGLAIEEPERLWLVGQRAFDDGLYPLARRALERFVDQYPQDPRLGDAVLLLGRARFVTGDTEAALEAFTRVPATEPPAARKLELKFWEAESLFRLKRYGEARTAYDVVIRTDAASPLAPEALYGYGWSELELKRPEPAITAFRDFLKTWPEHALAPSAMYQMARAQTEVKRYNEAELGLRELLAKFPKARIAGDAQYLLAWTRIQAGDTQGGVEDLRAFVKANPTHELAPRAQGLIAETFAKQGNRADVLKVYRALMAQSPPTPEALSEAADIAGRLGNPKDQEAAWRKLVAQFPEHPLARRAAYTLATAAFKREQWKDAAAFGEKAAAAADDDELRAEAWLTVGESELKLQRFAPAAKAFEAVGAVKSPPAWIRFSALAGLGLAREQQKNWAAALAAYETVAAKSPDTKLRDWAKDRARAVRSQMSATPANGRARPKAGS
ncbi:MAG: tetratricopeptide repeat protein [Candidatus Rokubacteria bacterium]|nr:tetratricopeptide repeat protein [Candidatus Rokubacteria bacterium]